MAGEHIQSNKQMQKTPKEDMDKANSSSSPALRTQNQLNSKSGSNLNPSGASGTQLNHSQSLQGQLN